MTVAMSSDMDFLLAWSLNGRNQKSMQGGEEKGSLFSSLAFLIESFHFDSTILVIQTSANHAFTLKWEHPNTWKCSLCRYAASPSPQISDTYALFYIDAQISVASLFTQVCIGVLDPAGVRAPGVAESAPPTFFFFFFFLAIRAGVLVCAARSDKYEPHVRQRFPGRFGSQNTVSHQYLFLATCIRL
jgi:hypothetical protein